ncbi:hypothetical protein CI102_6430 [Trichoderma harzianum]|nr:hypothetical protein CI102_6430 [Trichoderma harzianum]
MKHDDDSHPCGHDPTPKRLPTGLCPKSTRPELSLNQESTNAASVNGLRRGWPLVRLDVGYLSMLPT